MATEQLVAINVILRMAGYSLLNSTQLNEHLWTQVLKHLNVHIYLVTIALNTIINLFRVLICRRFQSG